MQKPNGIFLDRDSLHPADLNFTPLSQVAHWQYYATTSPEQLEARLQNAEIVVSNKVLLSRETLQTARHLKLVVIAATGVNNVDLQACEELGIAVYNCQRYGNEAVIQHLFAMIFGLANQLSANHAAARQKWASASQFCLLDHLPMQLSGKTLGIIGYGALGQKAQQVASALDMHTLIAARKGATASAGRTEFETLLAEADIITLHCPLTPDTHNLIAARELALMKPSALLINTARGGIVNETDLVAALTAGQIAGAAADVLSEEPPRKGNPLLEYAGHNLILTPHMAWGSSNARQTMLEQIAENISHFYAGNRQRRVV